MRNKKIMKESKERIGLPGTTFDSADREANIGGCKGFTLIELLVGIAIMVVLVTGVLGAVSALNRTVKLARENTILNSLVASDLEIVRNMPYSQVGTLNGNPSGTLPDATNPKNITSEGRSYQIYYEVTYIDDPADGTLIDYTDSFNFDYKQVKMFVKEVAIGKIITMLTNVVPKGLEYDINVNTGSGALSIQVIDAVGQPVSGANIHITNLQVNPNIILDRTSDTLGKWLEVGLPAGENIYNIVVTKPGYSIEQTYDPYDVQTSNPVKPNATIMKQEVTQVSFAVDVLSNLTLKTLDEYCQPLNNVGINVRGDKIINTNPIVYKVNNNYTSSAGQVALPNIEWDNYTPVLQTGQPYTIYGTSPVQQVNVLPATSQTFTFILGPATQNSYRVIVKDAATGAPVEGAQVHLHKGGGTPQDYYATTGGSVWAQTDWSSGSGQTNWQPQPPGRSDKYFSDDGGTDVATTPTGVRLQKIAGNYVLSGSLESSTFDTGTNQSNYSTITWQPTSQNPATTLKFQIATSNDPAGPWNAANYKGPDGTNATYYTVSGTTIHSTHDSNRYMRYKVFLSTTNNQQTPVLTSVLFNYVSGCFTPGQTVFTNLAAGNNYSLDITLTGYQVYTDASVTVGGNVVNEVLMSP